MPPQIKTTTPSLASGANPPIGGLNGGNTFPGAMLPVGMLQWSPANTAASTRAPRHRAVISQPVQPARHAARQLYPESRPHGSWPAFAPCRDDGFVEATASVYLWMVPFDVQGLFDTLGGRNEAAARRDTLFHDKNGGG